MITQVNSIDILTASPHYFCRWKHKRRNCNLIPGLQWLNTTSIETGPAEIYYNYILINEVFVISRKITCSAVQCNVGSGLIFPKPVVT